MARDRARVISFFIVLVFFMLGSSKF